MLTNHLQRVPWLIRYSNDSILTLILGNEDDEHEEDEENKAKKERRTREKKFITSPAFSDDTRVPA